MIVPSVTDSLVSWSTASPFVPKARCAALIPDSQGRLPYATFAQKWSRLLFRLGRHLPELHPLLAAIHGRRGVLSPKEKALKR